MKALYKPAIGLYDYVSFKLTILNRKFSVYTPLSKIGNRTYRVGVPKRDNLAFKCLSLNEAT